MSVNHATVLVVDDEPANIDLMKGILPQGIKVKAAINGEKALKIAGGDSPPDVILLDVMMPAMDGYEVFRRLRADSATSGIPVVFVSGHDDETERQKAMALGAAGFVSKPVDPGQLLDMLQRLLAGAG